MAKKIKNVLELAKTVAGSDAFVDDLAEHLAKRALVSKLAALRAAKGLTQQEIATKMGSTQSQVSRMEASEDFDLNFASIVRFAQAMDVCVELTLISKSTTAVNRVKHHAFCIKRLTDQLANLAVADRTIADGVAQFFSEAAFNLLHMLEDSAKRLPQPSEERAPLVVVDACGTGDSEEMREDRNGPPKRRMNELCST